MNEGMNIFPLLKEDRTNKSPYRLMKNQLERRIQGMNIKITGFQRASKTKNNITPIYEDSRKVTSLKVEQPWFDTTSAMNLKHILSRDLDKSTSTKGTFEVVKLIHVVNHHK